MAKRLEGVPWVVPTREIFYAASIWDFEENKQNAGYQVSLILHICSELGISFHAYFPIDSEDGGKLRNVFVATSKKGSCW